MLSYPNAEAPPGSPTTTTPRIFVVMPGYNVAKAGVEAMGDTLRPELKHLGVRVGVAHMTFVDTDMVRGADEHPVFGRVRTGMPLAGKTYPLEFAVDKFVDGIRKRSRTASGVG